MRMPETWLNLSRARQWECVTAVALFLAALGAATNRTVRGIVGDVVRGGIRHAQATPEEKENARYASKDENPLVALQEYLRMRELPDAYSEGDKAVVKLWWNSVQRGTGDCATLLTILGVVERYDNLDFADLGAGVNERVFRETAVRMIARDWRAAEGMLERGNDMAAYDAFCNARSLASKLGVAPPEGMGGEEFFRGLLSSAGGRADKLTEAYRKRYASELSRTR